MPLEAEAVIAHIEKRDASRLQFQSMSRLRIFVEMVKQIVESEARNDENAE